MVLHPAVFALGFGGDVGLGNSAKKNASRSISVFAIPDLNKRSVRGCRCELTALEL